MKTDELGLLTKCAAITDGHHPNIFPRDLVPASMSAKRAAFLFSKWTDRGWYEYGTSLDLGWVTDEGYLVAQLSQIEAQAVAVAISGRSPTKAHLSPRAYRVVATHITELCDQVYQAPPVSSDGRKQLFVHTAAGQVEVVRAQDVTVT